MLDAPGHRDFVPNMISGSSQADVAILVIDASTGGFESGFGPKGQTREHALLLKSLGIEQLIVCVNKMDTVEWSVDRFESIKSQLFPYLSSIGFNVENVNFIPVSGFTGDNLTKAVTSNWYKGPTLVEGLDLFEFPKRDIDQPFYLSVQDYYKGGLGPGGSGAVTVCGRIASGSIQVGDKILAMPINQIGTIKAIQVGEDEATWAIAGDRVSISINGLDIIQFHLGTVVCDPVNPITVTNNFRATITTFDLDIPLTIGVPIVMHHLGTAEAGRIYSLESIKLETGEKKKPRSLGKHTFATVLIHLDRPVCIQNNEQSKELSRFLLRKGSESIAAGSVVEILKID